MYLLEDVHYTLHISCPNNNCVNCNNCKQRSVQKKKNNRITCKKHFYSLLNTLRLWHHSILNGLSISLKATFDMCPLQYTYLLIINQVGIYILHTHDLCAKNVILLYLKCYCLSWMTVTCYTRMNSAPCNRLYNTDYYTTYNIYIKYLNHLVTKT